MSRQVDVLRRQAEPNAHHRPVWPHLARPTPVPLNLLCDLGDRVAEIGKLNDAACWFVELVVNRIADTGKHVDDLTVRELREIVEECQVASDAAAKRKLARWKPLTPSGLANRPASAAPVKRLVGRKAQEE